MTESFITTKNGSRIVSWIIFALPALALDVHFGLGLVEASLLICTIIFARQILPYLCHIPADARWIVIAFAVDLAVALLTISWNGMEFNFLENPARRLLLMAAIALVPLVRARASYLWAGLIVGCLSALAMAAYQVGVLHADRAGGAHHPILFGDVALAMGLMSLAVIGPLQYARRVIYKFLPFVAFIAGMCASALSGSRGGWATVLLAIVPFSLYEKKRRFRVLIALVLVASSVVVVTARLIPAGVSERTQAAFSDIDKYRHGDTNTSIGMRLEMWRGAWQIFRDHPLTGVGRGNFRQALGELADKGVVSPGVREFPHAHNELLNALATGGILGAVSLLLMYAAPLYFFVRARRSDAEKPFAFAGIVLVLAYVVFGLTEVLFSQHFGAAFYAAFVAVLTGFCLMQRQECR